MKYIASPIMSGVLRTWHITDVKTKAFRTLPVWPPISVRRGTLIRLDFGDVEEQAIDLSVVIETFENQTYVLPFKVVK